MENRIDKAYDVQKYIVKNMLKVSRIFNRMESSVVILLGEIFNNREIIKFKYKGELDTENGYLPIFNMIYTSDKTELEVDDFVSGNVSDDIMEFLDEMLDKYNRSKNTYAMELKIDYKKKRIYYKNNIKDDSTREWKSLSEMSDDYLKFNFLEDIITACRR